MKKIMIAILGLFMIMSFATMVSAETQTGTTSSRSLTFAASNTPGPPITFTPSPSTLMSVTTSDVAFSITAASSKTTTDTGLEYGILSSSNAVYQMAQAANNAVTATTSATALPSTSFQDKDGNTAP